MKDIKFIRRENKLNKEKPKYAVKIAVWGFLAFLLIFFGTIYGKQLTFWFISSLPINQPVIEYKDPLQEALKTMELKTSWNVVSLSGIDSLYMNIDIQNNGDKDINNFEITCVPDYGTAVINKNKANIFQPIISKAHISLKEYNFGQVTDKVKNVSCSVTDLSLKT